MKSKLNNSFGKYIKDEDGIVWDISQEPSRVVGYPEKIKKERKNILDYYTDFFDKISLRTKKAIALSIWSLFSGYFTITGQWEFAGFTMIVLITVILLFKEIEK